MTEPRCYHGRSNCIGIELHIYVMRCKVIGGRDSDFGFAIVIVRVATKVLDHRAHLTIEVSSFNKYHRSNISQNQGALAVAPATEGLLLCGHGLDFLRSANMRSQSYASYESYESYQ